MTDAHLQGVWDASAELLARVPFHIGVAVRSIEEQSQAMTALFGLHWHPITEPSEVHAMTPASLAGSTLRRTHSVEGPIHVELCEGEPTSTWGTGERPAQVHHLAYWSPDVAEDVDALIARGWELEATLLGEDLRPSCFAYLGQRQRVTRIEVVARDCAGTSWWPADHDGLV